MHQVGVSNRLIDMKREPITMEEVLDVVYGGMVRHEHLIIAKWAKRRVWWKRLFGFAVRRWQFNETFVKTADGKEHRAGPI